MPTLRRRKLFLDLRPPIKMNICARSLKRKNRKRVSAGFLT
jgi:hypothetical protein